LADYPWYESVSGSELAQGDCIPNCPILKPQYDSALTRDDDPPGIVLKSDVAIYDCVIMTQACDLEQEKVEDVVLCPYQDLGSFLTDHPKYSTEKMRRGDMPGFHMLNECPDPAMRVSVVTFHEIFSVPKGFLEGLAEMRGPRPRLLPPYREHLSQAFARYFMRVGLPLEITGL